MGAGLTIQGTFDAPLAGDIYTVRLTNGLDVVAIGTTVQSASPWGLTMGMDNLTLDFLSGDSIGCALGTAVVIAVSIARAAGGIADAAAFPGYTWDPVSGLLTLLDIVQSQIRGLASSADLARVFPPP